MTNEINVEQTLAKLALPSKIKLLTGAGWCQTASVPEADIPSVRMCDGPNGIRGTQRFKGVASSCFPCCSGLGSSFDIELAKQIGEALGDECRAKSVHALLAPAVNTQRSPLGGRGFESFSEDPHLNGTIAAAYIDGVQSKGVASVLKHFVANDQEFQRFSVSSDVSERALREIYLKPFQIAIKKANPWAVMAAYNRVNGIHVSEDSRLLHDVLRKEWAWEGLITSDWTGTYSTAEAIKAGLDLEMPGPTVMRGMAVNRAIAAGKITADDVDARVRNVLQFVERAKQSGIPFDGPEGSIDTPELRALLRKAASDATVLLKNDKNLLPLRPGVGKIAVIGPNAKTAVVSGGGSASLRATYAVSPLEGITDAASEIGAKVKYAVGAYTHKYLPLIDPYIAYNGEPGGLFEFWNKLPRPDWLSVDPDLSVKLPDPVWTTSAPSGNSFLGDGVDETKVNKECWLRFLTTFTPDEDGDWKIGLNVVGRGNMFLDGKLIAELSVNPKQGGSFFDLGTNDAQAIIPGLKAGQQYAIEVRTNNAEFVARGLPFPCRGAVRIGAVRDIAPKDGVLAAVELAKKADVVILVVGLNNDYESGGYDRANMELPGLTNKLVSKVLQANPNTIVVNQSGTPVEMPWADEAHTILHGFYGGNEAGNGIADILFGKVNPSGKLSLSFPKHLEDSPSHTSFGNFTQVEGKVLYNEGIFVGYRGFEIKRVAPLFPFGYGLSYTTFEYSALELSPISDDGTFSATFTIKNTGTLDGQEIAQVYITDPESSLPRPKKELHGFVKVALKAGESKSATVELDKYALSFYDERRASWVAEAGKFEVHVAASSTDIRLSGEVELKKTITWTGL